MINPIDMEKIMGVLSKIDNEIDRLYEKLEDDQGKYDGSAYDTEMDIKDYEGRMKGVIMVLEAIGYTVWRDDIPPFAWRCEK